VSESAYDLIVIGSGPAGESAAVHAAYLGKHVALIEKEDYLGGAAANTGTIPSKTLREAALHLAGLRRRGLRHPGLTQNSSWSVEEFLFRKEMVRNSERARISANIHHHTIERLQGIASFKDDRTLILDGPEPRTLSAGRILIATGSRPARPGMFRFEEDDVYDSDSITQISALPPSMVIVGGGIIGVEYACLFAALGVRVTLVNSRGRILPFLDSEIAQLLIGSMRAMGIELEFNSKVQSVKRVDAGWLLRTDSDKSFEGTCLLVTAGRRSNVEALHLENTGIRPGEKGLIPVNAHYQTSVPHIYAAGDVIGFPALASTSTEQGRLAIRHAFQAGPAKPVGSSLPYGIYTIPECSMAGATEPFLQDKNIPYVVGRARYSNSARGKMIGDDLGRMKLIFRKPDLKLIGIHIIGEQATELVHLGLAAMKMKADIRLFLESCYNYPTLSEMYRYAAYDALDQLPEDERKPVLS